MESSPIPDDGWLHLLHGSGNAGVQNWNLLQKNLHQTHPHHVSSAGHTLYCHWIHGRMVLQESTKRWKRSSQPCASFLQYSLLVRTGNNGPLCSSGDHLFIIWGSPIISVILQLVVGMFSFLALLACESATARFRAKLVPVHAIIGTATFILAIATCVCGLTERAFLDLG